MPDRGSFWLGNSVDPATGSPGDDRLTVGSADLTTHGVVVGMTGSGKTGLGMVLLEEALLAGIPVLAIDPKGDMGNLALTFPDLAPASFAPWVSAAEADAAGASIEEQAARTAATWRDGLAASGIGTERLQELRDAADVTIYTPGSTAGVPLNVIGSLRAPGLSWDDNAEALRDEIEGLTTGLLGLIGIEADPLASREHVLLANLVEHAWRAGRDLDLGALIGDIQAPPVRKLGVFEIDAFFPPDDRMKLALRLNALIASPSFAAWGEGPAIDPQELLFTSDGKPRAAIVYLAHLSDEERMFAATLVFSKLVTWMRGQSGTPDLRALVYMDEVAGFAPPTAAPAAKKPILTILKQGRAFGLGLVLSTQNPVDLDYKAMSNAGTWLVGRLQTENDKARVLEALRSAAGDTDVTALDEAIGALGKRRFLLVSARASEPSVFGTRWAMAYLRGPLTRDEVSTLMQGHKPAAPEPHSTARETVAELAADESRVAPAVADGTKVSYLDPAARWARAVAAVPGGTRLQAFVAARVSLRYDDTRVGIDEQQEFEAVYGPLGAELDLDTEIAVDYDDRDFGSAAPRDAVYVLPEAALGEAKLFASAAKAIQRRLVDSLTLDVYRNPVLKLTSRPGENEHDFGQRCDEAGRTEADRAAAKIKDRLEAKRDRLEQALTQAQQRAEELDADTRSRQATELVAGAGAVLGALLGGRRSTRSITGAIGSAASRRGVSSRSAQRRKTAREKIEDTTDDLAELEQEILDELAELDEEWRDTAAIIEPLSIRLEAADVHVVETRLVWVPTG